MADQEARPRHATLNSLIVIALTPTFLGVAPFFAKLAYLGGSDPFTVAASRTVIAAMILWVIYLLFWRRFIYIYPAGLLGCVVVGMTNGIGSLFFYNGLHYLDASLAQLLNSTYLIFVVILALMGGQPLKRRTIIRALMALFAVMLLTGGHQGQMNWLGVGLMVGNAILFAGSIILSQRVLYEMPSPTVTLYVLTTMAVVVVMARVVYRLEWIPQSGEAAGAIFALGITTALSRLTLFTGVKKLGSMQTVLAGIFETAVTLLLALAFLNEQLSPIQWIGVGILVISLLLLRPGDLARRVTGEVPIVNMAGMSFQHIAFTQAFHKTGTDKLTTQELEAIRRMLEAPPRYDEPPGK